MLRFALTLFLLALTVSGGISAAAAHESNRHEDTHYRIWTRPYDRQPPRYDISLTPWDRQTVSALMEKEFYQRCRQNQRDHREWNSRSNCNRNSGHGMAYRVGNRLPPQTIAWSVPRSVRPYLPRPASGTQYLWVNRDILLVASNSGMVLDAIRVL